MVLWAAKESNKYRGYHRASVDKNKLKKIKVLRIIARLNIGGPAIHTVLLTAGLDTGRFESVLVCGAVSPGEGDMAYYARERGVRPVYIPELRRELNLLNDLIAFVKICRIIRVEKPDIIHTHTAKAGALGRVAGILYNYGKRLLRPFGARNDIEIIHTFHGHIFEGYFGSLSTRVFIIIEKLLACFTDKIITVSEEVRKELISLGICRADNIAVVPLGFELEKFLTIPECGQGEDCFVANAPRNDKWGVDSQFRIGIVGRLVPVKNHRMFLEAIRDCFPRLRRGRNDISLKFKIIGDGELRDELERYAGKLSLGGDVEFVGWQKDLVKVYSELDIVCLTSLNEGTPVSLIEAMACARVVVATEVGGVPDLLGQVVEERDGFSIRERGISALSKDAQGFARALAFILDNPGAGKSLAQAAREYVKTVFSKERLVRDMENMYCNLVLTKV